MGPEQNPFTRELHDLSDDHVVIDHETGKKVDPSRIHIAPGEAMLAVASGLAVGVAFSFPLFWPAVIADSLAGVFSGYLFDKAKESMSVRREEQVYQFSAAADGLIENITPQAID
ncbi:hypothetical protein HY409_01910 [Candidatus Gottesmanbacteria bacterium]|nr:hypothetical protein [Candidatus Gottesmanbacteria bacterium]